MFSFSQKIFISYIVLFLTFLLLMIPLSNQIIQSITNKTMEDRATALIETISSAKNNEALIRTLKDLKNTLFFRVAVVTDEKKVLYDSNTKRLIGSRFNQEYKVNHPEVLRAFKNGSGYHEEYSELLSQKFSYFAKAFDFHGKTYILRIAFPFDYFKELKEDLKKGFILVATLTLLLFSLMTWILIHTLTKPIQKIIDAIKPFQEGTEKSLPEIALTGSLTSPEFSKLALTLNSLSIKIKNQIEDLTKERDLTKKLLDMRKDFIANASHELKTPLTIIQGFAEALEDNPDLSTDVRIDISSKILRHSKRMNQIIQDLLILSDVENIPDSRLQTLNICDILKKCILHVKELYKSAEIELVEENEKMEIVGDPYLLEVAFNNLIENGAKYSKENPKIKIEAKKIKKVLTISISDKGIGIPSDDLEHIFERFYTVNKAHSRKLGGSGLGLSITETIIEKHFGKISVSSIVGEGTTFLISLPLEIPLKKSF